MQANKGLKQVRTGDDHGTTREYNQPAPAVLVGARVWLAAWTYGLLFTCCRQILHRLLQGEVQQ
jgi:hypothetical protein